jgi:hypothetical protein
MSTDLRFNGWTNYETWRVNLEFFDGYQGVLDHETAREMVEEHINETTKEGLSRDWALSFVSNVNWHELAKHYQGNEEGEE